jgi:hypothetical protein
VLGRRRDDFLKRQLSGSRLRRAARNHEGHSDGNSRQSGDEGQETHGRQYAQWTGAPTSRSITRIRGSYIRGSCEHVFVWSKETSFADGAFFAGFVAGDGSFSIRANNAGASWCCGLQVKLRADDTPLLEALRHWSGAGQLWSGPARGGSRPQTTWMIGWRRSSARALRSGTPRAAS